MRSVEKCLEKARQLTDTANVAPIGEAYRLRALAMVWLDLSRIAEWQGSADLHLGDGELQG